MSTCSIQTMIKEVKDLELKINDIEVMCLTFEYVKNRRLDRKPILELFVKKYSNRSVREIVTDQKHVSFMMEEAAKRQGMKFDFIPTAKTRRNVHIKTY